MAGYTDDDGTAVIAAIDETAATNRGELQDIHEQLSEANALMRELLIHIREMTGLSVREDDEP